MGKAAKRRFIQLKVKALEPWEKAKTNNLARKLPGNKRRELPEMQERPDPNGTPEPNFSFWEVVDDMKSERLARKESARLKEAAHVEKVAKAKSVTHVPQYRAPDDDFSVRDVLYPDTSSTGTAQMDQGDDDATHTQLLHKLLSDDDKVHAQRNASLCVCVCMYVWVGGFLFAVYMCCFPLLFSLFPLVSVFINYYCNDCRKN